MSVQYYIVIIIVAFIVICQVVSFFKNISIINKLRALFPGVEKLSLNDDNTITCENTNAEFQETLDNINEYLRLNKTKSADYQIIKEIVERDSEKTEDDVNTMLTSPLYLGLMATIVGAAIGVIFFAWTDLEALLTGVQIHAQGIKTLLTDIGIAMTASFLGVFFTAITTAKYKDARGDMLKRKNQFLSWIQTRVMPNMSDSLTGALIKMAQDLNHFNSTFAENTKELKETLSRVTDNYDSQIQLLDAIDRIKIEKIAKANVTVYDKLQGCTEEIEKLFEHLGKSEEYIAQVVKLNSSLGDIEARTKLSEELGNYFKQEIEFVQDRQGIMRQQMSGLDSVVQESLENLGASISGLIEIFQKQNQQVQALIEEQQIGLSKALEEQRNAINNKIEEINDPFGGLKDTFKEIGEQSRKGIESIVSTFDNQNTVIKEMLDNQKQLLETEIANQREGLKQQFVALPSQMDNLATVLDNLNQTILKQQQKIDSQSEIIKELISKNTIPNDSSLKAKSKWVNNYLLTFAVVGSFILLLAMFIVQLLDIKL